MFSESGKISRKIWHSKIVSRLIDEYWKETNHPFACKDICRHLLKQQGIRLTEGVVAQILKKSLNMSYKIGKSRPVGIQMDKYDLLKCYFAISIIPILSQLKFLLISMSLLSPGIQIWDTLGQKRDKQKS